MNKKPLIIAVVSIAGLIILGMIAYLLIPNKNNTTVVNAPTSLSQQDTDNIKAVSESFFDFYNTYSFDDFTNLNATGDYSTANIQYETISYTDFLKENTKENYLQTAVADMNNFKINGIESGVVNVEFPGTITDEYTNDLKSKKTTKVNNKFELILVNGKWKVTSFETK